MHCCKATLTHHEAIVDSTFVAKTKVTAEGILLKIVTLVFLVGNTIGRLLLMGTEVPFNDLWKLLPQYLKTLEVSRRLEQASLLLVLDAHLPVQEVVLVH